MIDIIVPVYNTKKDLLERCLASLHNQTYQDYLITIVDDGSNEDTKLLLKKYETKNKIQVIFKEVNQGVSAARNTGMEETSAEFVTFVDADDTVKPNFLQNAMRTYKNTGADIVIGCLEYISGSCITPHILNTCEKYSVYTEKDILDLLENLLTNKGTSSHRELEDFLDGAPVAKLYKRNIISSIKFPEGISVYEDILFNFMVFSKAKKVVITDEIWYTYYQYEISAIHGFNASLLNSYLNSLPFICNGMRTYKMLEDSLSYFFLVETKTLLRNYFYYSIKNKRRKMKNCFDNEKCRAILQCVSIKTLSRNDRFIYKLIFNRNYRTLICILWIYKCKKAIS